MSSPEIRQEIAATVSEYQRVRELSRQSAICCCGHAYRSHVLGKGTCIAMWRGGVCGCSNSHKDWDHRAPWRGPCAPRRWELQEAEEKVVRLYEMLSEEGIGE